MGTPVSSIRNLGPAFEAACTAAGIGDAETLRSLGAHEAYRQILLSGGQPHFIGYYVLHMALQGRPWNDCKGKEKDTLRAAFDKLKSEVGKTGAHADSAFEAMMNEIGIMPRKGA